MVDRLDPDAARLKIAPAELGTRPTPAPRTADHHGHWPYVAAVCSIMAVTIFGLLVFPYITLADITMLYLIAITVASLPGRRPSLVAASLAVAAFDFFFVPPRFTLAVSDARHLLTFAVMFGAGLVIGTLTSRLRRQERDAIHRERRTAALLAFTREVASAEDESQVAVVAARHLEAGIDAAAAVLVPESDGGLVAAAGLMPLAVQEASVARWAFEHRQRAGEGTDTLPDTRMLAIPLVDGDAAVGVIALQRRKGSPTFDADQVHLLDALARQSTLALSRVRLARQAKESAFVARTEELRSSLLSAVSHDLRTPLAVITGAATTLRDDADKLDPQAREEMLATIVDDAQRLERVLANLLQLTRVETGFEPARELVPADEVVGGALTRLENVLAKSEVQVEVAEALALWVDPVLFEQVLINLLENALKHAAPPFSIRVESRAREAVLEIGDRGPGLPDVSQRLFEKFVRASSAPGAGLGLAVVRAIVTAHGGSVTAESREGGGALFRVTLPARAEDQAVA